MRSRIRIDLRYTEGVRRGRDVAWEVDERIRDVALYVDEVLREDRKKDERGRADRTWRKGSMGYRKRTSLWEIRLRDMVMMRDVHASRANILRGTMSSLGEIESCGTELAAGAVDVCSAAAGTVEVCVDGDFDGRTGSPCKAWNIPNRANGNAVVRRSGSPSVR